MGDFLTHLVVAERVPGRIESRRVAEGIRTHAEVYRLGAQGPDPLFYHHCFPGDGKGSLVAVGQHLHAHRTGQFLRHGFRQLAPVSWNEDWMTLAAWLCGMVCHYHTDRALHPYVNAVSHNWIWTEAGVPVQTTHDEVERMLDVLLWQDAGHGPATRARLHTLCPGPGPWPEPIVNCWVTALYEVYRLHVDEKLLEEIPKDMHRANRLLYDPRGVKKKLLHWVDSLTGGAFHPAKVPYPEQAPADIDWLNRKRRGWSQPELPNTRRNESVEMLIQKAADNTANTINGIFAVLFRQQGRLEDWLPDIDYNTDLPCVEDQAAGEGATGETNG